MVTDRQVLDKYVRDTIKQFAQVSATVGHAEHSGDLRRFLKAGKKIIITTVQKFPFILDEIGEEHRRRKFAIIIDEAHSSQGGKTTAAMNHVLEETAPYGGAVDEGEETVEDKINKIMEGPSYFAFTATPKNKTLEIFGEPDPQPDGTVKHHPFHSYTMKQAIQKGFILDVLKNYTGGELLPPGQDHGRRPALRRQQSPEKAAPLCGIPRAAICEKAEIMVDHTCCRHYDKWIHARCTTTGGDRQVWCSFRTPPLTPGGWSPFRLWFNRLVPGYSSSAYLFRGAGNLLIHFD